MFPSTWFSRRRAVKGQRNQSVSSFQFSSPSSYHQWREDDTDPPASFAQALSLDKSISKVRSSLLESELAEFQSRHKDLDCKCISNINRPNDAERKSTTDCLHKSPSQTFQRSGRSLSDARNYLSDEVINPSWFSKRSASISGTAFPRFGSSEHDVFRPADGEVDNGKSHSSSSNAHTSKASPRDIRRFLSCVQSGQRASNDNYTEDSTTLTSDSVESSFGSESSSTGSSKAQKYVLERSEKLMSRLHCPNECGLSTPEPMEGGNLSDSSSQPCYIERISPASAERKQNSMPEVAFELSTCAIPMQGTLKLNDLEPAVELRDHLHSNELYSPKNQASSIYRLDPHCEDDLGTSRSLDSLCGRCSASSSCLTNSSYTKSDEHNSTSAENSSYMLSNEWQVEADPRSLIYEHSSDVDKWQGDVTEEIDSQLPEYERYPRYSVTGLCITDRDGIALIEDDTDGHRSKRDAYVKKGRRQRGSSFSAALPDALQHVVGDSVALVKISESPYEDFRQSIYEMIMDNDVEGLINVEDLLHCYLALNPPELHVLIRDAFTDVWSSILMNEMTI